MGGYESQGVRAKGARMGEQPVGRGIPLVSLALLRGIFATVRRHVDQATWDALLRDVPTAVMQEVVAGQQGEAEAVLLVLVAEMAHAEERT